MPCGCGAGRPARRRSCETVHPARGPRTQPIRDVPRPPGSSTGRRPTRSSARLVAGACARTVPTAPRPGPAGATVRGSGRPRPGRPRGATAPPWVRSPRRALRRRARPHGSGDGSREASPGRDRPLHLPTPGTRTGARPSSVGTGPSVRHPRGDPGLPVPCVIASDHETITAHPVPAKPLDGCPVAGAGALPRASRDTPCDTPRRWVTVTPSSQRPQVARSAQPGMSRAECRAGPSPGRASPGRFVKVSCTPRPSALTGP